MKKFWKIAVAAVSCVVALHAQAQLTFSASVAGAGTYVAPVFTTATPTTAYVATNSLVDVRLAPLGTVASYLALSTGGSATVDLDETSTFSFLWGSPDLFNSISITTTTGIETFSGLDFQTMFGLAANGNNANTRLFTILAGTNQLLNSITFASSGIAFELAVASAVPEPENYALLLAGLMVVFYVSRRINGRDGR